jgi:hypothetical protein
VASFRFPPHARAAAARRRPASTCLRVSASALHGSTSRVAAADLSIQLAHPLRRRPTSSRATPPLRPCPYCPLREIECYPGVHRERERHRPLIGPFPSYFRYAMLATSRSAPSSWLSSSGTGATPRASCRRGPLFSCPRVP